MREDGPTVLGTTAPPWRETFGERTRRSPRALGRPCGRAGEAAAACPRLRGATYDCLSALEGSPIWTRRLPGSRSAGLRSPRASRMHARIAVRCSTASTCCGASSRVRAICAMDSRRFRRDRTRSHSKAATLACSATAAARSARHCSCLARHASGRRKVSLTWPLRNWPPTALIFLRSAPRALLGVGARATMPGWAAHDACH